MSAHRNDELPKEKTAPSATAKWPYSTTTLVDQLVARGFLPHSTVSAAVADATAAGAPVVSVLLERGATTDTALRDAIAAIFNLEAVSLGDVAPASIEAIPNELARANLLLPLGEDEGRLVVAVHDPTRAAALREAYLAAGRTLVLRVAAYGELARAVQDTYAPRVTVREPSGRSTTYMLPPGDATIGRAEHNDIVASDLGMSATHAVLRGEGERYVVVDMGSRNGVFVNGERVERAHELRHKDELRVGATTIRFRWPYGKKLRRSHDEPEPAKPKKFKIRKAWIAFAGRIIAQMLGAAALIFLGLAIGGGLPQSCSTPAPTQSAPAAKPVD